MIELFLIHDVVVEPWVGRSGTGDVFGPPVECRGLVEDEQRILRTDAGEEVVSGTTVYLPVGVVDVPLKSRVTTTVAGVSRTSSVLVVARRDAGALAPIEHVEIALR